MAEHEVTFLSSSKAHLGLCLISHLTCVKCTSYERPCIQAIKHMLSALISYQTFNCSCEKHLQVILSNTFHLSSDISMEINTSTLRSSNIPGYVTFSPLCHSHSMRWSIHLLEVYCPGGWSWPQSDTLHCPWERGDHSLHVTTLSTH